MAKRTVSELTRKRLAAHARRQQGQNGKWESNAKKALARKAKKSSMRLGSLWARSRAKKKSIEKAAIREAAELTKDLDICVGIAGEATLRELLPRIDALAVSASVLKRTMFPRTLRSAVDRCPATKLEVQPILLRWRGLFQRDVGRAREVAVTPSAMVAAAAASTRRSALGVNSDACSSAAAIAPPTAACRARPPSSKTVVSIEAAAAASTPVKTTAGPSTGSGVQTPGKSRRALVAAAVANARGISKVTPAKERQRSPSVTSRSSSSSSSSSSSVEEVGQSPSTKPTVGGGTDTVDTSVARPVRKRPLKQKRITAFFAP